MSALLRRIDRALFGRLVPDYPALLERNVFPECETLLDVGCGGPGSVVEHFAHRLRYSVGVDAFAPSIELARERGKHSEYRVMNALSIGEEFGERSFDCVLASDLIEHLTKADGERLIAMMERIARKRVIIFTPNGFLPQEPYAANVFQLHRSGWQADEMRARGYRVIGFHGWKPLLGERAEARWWPSIFWTRVAWLSQPLVENRPEHAFQILCIKDLT